MVLTTLALAATLAGHPATHATASSLKTGAGFRAPVTVIVPVTITAPVAAIELHSMTEEEKRVFPGRERFDKTEWYESCFKCVRSVISPEHVDEWKNGGVDAA